MDTALLSQHTLVLNRSWSAIATTTVRHALQLLFTGAAKAIRPDTYELHGFETWAELAVAPSEPCIRTVALQIKIPEIIVLTRYNGFPSHRVVFNRRNLYRRDRNTCQYCGARPGTRELSIDHILPRSRGGEGSWTNCVLACMHCNRRKANRLPAEAGVTLLRRPFEPRWSPTLSIPVGRMRQTWEQFVSESYWDVELED